MPSNFTSSDEHDLQRTLHPYSENFGTRHEKGFYVAGESDDGSQKRSTQSSPRTHTFGEIPTEFMPADGSDSELPCTTDDTLYDTQSKPIHPRNIGSIIVYLWTPPLPNLTENHPLAFTFIRTLQAFVWAFGSVGLLKVTAPNVSIIRGCVAAGVLVGAVFVRHLAAYLRIQYPGPWKLTSSLLIHFFSFSLDRLNLREDPEAHGPAGQDTRVLREILLDSMNERLFKALVRFLTYPFGGFRDLYSLAYIVMKTLTVAGYMGSATVLAAVTRSPLQLSYQSFLLAEVIAGAVFLQLLSAYLRPEFPTLKIYVTWLIHSVTFVLCILLMPSAFFGVNLY